MVLVDQLHQFLGFLGIVLFCIWILAVVITQILYLIALFKADWLITLLSILFSPLVLIVLIQHWNEVKRPFLMQLGVVFAGIIGLIGYLGILAATTPAAPASSYSASTAGSSSTPTPSSASSTNVPGTILERPISTRSAAPSWGVEAPVGDIALLTTPRGWMVMPWTLPRQGLAMGSDERSEYVTVHFKEKDTPQSFRHFQKTAIEEVGRHIIKSAEATRSVGKPITAGPVVSYGLAGHSLLPGQAGQPMSARVSCVDGRNHFFYLVQWRTAAWDAESIRTFDRMLRSLDELPLAERL